MEKDEILKRFEAENWRDTIYRLTHYARWRATWYGWKSGRPDQLPGGKTPDDVALGAIEKVFNGTRNWDPDRYPDLLTHLMWIVNSDMGHLFNSLEHITTRRIPEIKGDDDRESQHGEIIYNPPSSVSEPLGMQTPEEVLLTREEDAIKEKIKKEIFSIVKGDEELEMVLLCIEEGIDKPELIAEQMGWDVSKVYTLKRKLLRKASKIDKILREEYLQSRGRSNG